ncbi:MAG: peptide methionine sulfoxide reductase MsrA [Pseudomonadota bacterium]
MEADAQTELITLAGGCFWCLEAVYERVDGVLAVENGYSNGHAERPSYEQVCSGRTGHAEVVRVRFDPARIGLAEILEIFFAVHDPTSRDRQGNDIGTQYRSAVYWHAAAQEPIVHAVRAQADAAHGGRVVTELAPEANYWRAEDYHQRYYLNHPEQAYCAFVVAPKVEKFMRTFRARVRA